MQRWPRCGGVARMHAAVQARQATHMPSCSHLVPTPLRCCANAQMDGCLFEGRAITVRPPGQPLARLPQPDPLVQQPQRGPELAQQRQPGSRAYVIGLPPSMEDSAAADLFRCGLRALCG